MGNCASQSQEAALSKELDRELTTSFREAKKDVKLLLLGTGESGKTTVIKQLRIIHTAGFSDDEIESWKENIHSNIITSMSALIKALEKSNTFGNLSPEEQQAAQLIMSPKILTYTALVPEVTNAIKTLWSSQIVRDRFDNKSDVQIIDSASYFFEHIDRIAAPDYNPNQTDIVYSRVRTTGITEVRIPLGANRLRLVDVGGQRSERRKWIHCFQEVTGILYISAVNEFDQKLREDDSTNRVEESVNLFKEVCSYDWFRSTPIILFLNKKDLLEEKIKKVQFSAHYPDFTGPATIKSVLDYFKDMFLQQASGRANFYFHFTCATDTECIKVVFRAIQGIIFNDNMNEIGFM